MRADPFFQSPASLTAGEAPTRFMPDFQIEQSDDSFVFKADLRGIKENEVDIAVTGDRLTISGHLYDPRACSYARFTRGFTLPQTHTADRPIRATLDGGMLTVTFPSLHGDDSVARWDLPGDDSLARWESEGGGVR